jgi:hypothetical protein
METQTQGKLFIVAGSLWLIISAYFLVSAFFPDKSTPATGTQITAENRDNNNNEQDEEVDFTQMLIEGQNKKNINVLMPEFLFTAWFDAIGKEVQEKNGIAVKFFTSKDKDIYNSLGDEWIYEWEEIDIILAPTDILLSLTSQSKFIPIAEKITPYYHASLSEIIDRETYTFIPHIIDPLVIYSHNNKPYPGTINDRLDIVIWRESPKRWYFPILFGFSTQNNHFLKQWREIMEDNFFILYHIIAHLTAWQDPIQDIKTLLDVLNLTKVDARNVADFISTSNRLARENPMCKIYPSLCLFAYGYWDSRIGLLSDISKINKYFSISDYVINPFRYTDSYPARWWGFLAHKDSISSRITMFLEAYIQASLVNINAQLWDRTIPASTLANSTINDPSIQGWLYDNNNRKVYIGENGSLSKTIQDNKIIELLDGNYTPELFVQNIQF